MNSAADSQGPMRDANGKLQSPRWVTRGVGACRFLLAEIRFKDPWVCISNVGPGAFKVPIACRAEKGLRLGGFGLSGFGSGPVYTFFVPYQYTLNRRRGFKAFRVCGCAVSALSPWKVDPSIQDPLWRILNCNLKDDSLGHTLNDYTTQAWVGSS